MRIWSSANTLTAIAAIGIVLFLYFAWKCRLWLALEEEEDRTYQLRVAQEDEERRAMGEPGYGDGDTGATPAGKLR